MDSWEEEGLRTFDVPAGRRVFARAEVLLAVEEDEEKRVAL